MSNAVPLVDAKAPPAESDVVPPDEEFWQKYSPHFEFPISTVSAVVFHVVAIAAAIYITTRLMRADETTPVPIRGVVVESGSLNPSGGSGGSGGGEQPMDVVEERPQPQRRQIPDAELQKEIISASTWIPDLKDNPEALKTIVKSGAIEKLDGLNEEMKKRIAGSFRKSPGTGDATAPAGDGNGTGSGGQGDAASSGSRSSRYVIKFRTNSGEDYLRQLAAFQANILIPEPPDWSANRLFEDISKPGPGRRLTAGDELPSMWFTDNDKESARKVARALGMNFSPPRFMAFFPKRVEEELAAKERAYRGLREDQIQETTFSVLERNGRFEIKVTEQIPIRR